MKKRFRIKKNKEILKVLSNKRTVGDKNFVIYLKESKLSDFRYAISISKKYGNAPERNLMKRRIKDIITREKINIKTKDFFIIIKVSAKKLSYEEIRKNIIKLLVRANIIGEENHEKI